MDILGYITLAICATMIVSTICYISIKECERAMIVAKNTKITIVKEDNNA